MADPGAPKLPPTDAGMNKIAPTARSPDDKGGRPLGTSKSKADDQKILERIRKRMSLCISAESENRKAALEDLKFKAGDQWPADVATQRNADRKPCLTFNKIPSYIHQVTNDQRQNRPSINVSPVGDRGDIEAAKMYRGMIRAIERDSAADIAYDTAFESAASCGIGYFRILTDWEAPDSFHQVIRIQRVRNAFSVYLDPARQEPDGADSKFGIVTEKIPRAEFDDQYPDAQKMPFTETGVGDSLKDWIGKDEIRVAEYYEIEVKKRTLVQLSNGHEGWKDDLDEQIAKQVSDGSLQVLQEREAECPQVKYYKVSGVEILERSDWLGQWIPIIPVIGDEIDIEGKVKYSGLIRNAKDAQRMYNYWMTKYTELVALAPLSPWVMEEGQIEGHEDQWRQAHQKSYPTLLYKATSVAGHPAPPPQRQPFAQIPEGVMNGAAVASQDLGAITGIQLGGQQGDQRLDHRESGRMLREQRRTTDLGSYHLVDNLARSLKHCGRQLVDLILKIYDEKRTVTILREDDVEELVSIDPRQAQALVETQRDGKKRKTFNPKVGKYGVTVTIGPSFATKRIEAAESMMEFVKNLPNTAALVSDLIAKYQDWPGAEEIATRLAKAIPPNLLTPDQKDIPPQVQALIQNLEAQTKQLGMELQAAMKALNEKEADRDVAREKIAADFEAKLLAVAQKAEEAVQKHVGSALVDLAKDVQRISEALSSPTEGEPKAAKTKPKPAA